MIDRHRARILAMQALCQLDVQGEGFQREVPAFLADSETCGPTITFAQLLIEKAWAERERFDAEFRQCSQQWDVKRLTPVDRNVLRVALAELDQGQTPPKVVISEAIDIGREFGSAESAAFINGVLDRMWKASHAPPEELS